MEPIALVFGSALVGAMATDTWEEARRAAVAIWRRIRSPQQADSISEELEGLRTSIVAARQTGRNATEQALAGVWQGRVHELLLDDPTLAIELHRVLDQTLTPMLAPSERTRISQISMTGSSHDSSTFSQVAGNQVNYER